MAGGNEKRVRQVEYAAALDVIKLKHRQQVYSLLNAKDELGRQYDFAPSVTNTKLAIYELNWDFLH